MRASPDRKGAAAAGSLKNPPKVMPDRETSCLQRPISFAWTHLDKPQLCPRRLQRLPCQREPQHHRPGRDRPRVRDRWVAKLLHLPEHRGPSRNGEGCPLRTTSMITDGRGRDPEAGRKGGGGESDIPRKRHSSNGRPVAQTIYSDRTVAVNAGGNADSSNGLVLSGSRPAKAAPYPIKPLICFLRERPVGSSLRVKHPMTISDVQGENESLMTRKLLMTVAIVAIALAPSIGIGTAQARGFGGGFARRRVWRPRLLRRGRRAALLAGGSGVCFVVA